MLETLILVVDVKGIRWRWQRFSTSGGYLCRDEVVPTQAGRGESQSCVRTNDGAYIFSERSVKMSLNIFFAKSPYTPQYHFFFFYVHRIFIYTYLPIYLDYSIWSYLAITDGAIYVLYSMCVCAHCIGIGRTIVVYPSLFFFFFFSKPLTHNRRQRTVSPSSNINATHTHIRVRGCVCAINWLLSRARAPGSCTKAR